jgi:hypothetical protein
VNDAPLAIRLSDTEGWCRVRRLALTHHTRSVLGTEERVNGVTLLLR